MSISINKVAVCGAGTMGSGIAQVCASAGFETVLYEVNETVLDNAKLSIEKNLQISIEKGKLDAGKKQLILNKILFTNDLQQCIADLVIEAIIEKPEIKISLFNQLAAINSVVNVVSYQYHKITLKSQVIIMFHIIRLTRQQFHYKIIAAQRRININIYQCIYAHSVYRFLIFGKRIILCKRQVMRTSQYNYRLSNIDQFMNDNL
jgi:UDP-glucose 6-dehydrogenase